MPREVHRRHSRLGKADVVAGGGTPACVTLERAHPRSWRHASRSESYCRCASESRNRCRSVTKSGSRCRCAYGSRNHCRCATGELPPPCRWIREPLLSRLRIREPPPSRLRIGKSPPPRLRIWDRPSVARPEAAAASHSRGTTVAARAKVGDRHSCIMVGRQNWTLAA
jgi:hypothetical protein